MIHRRTLTPLLIATVLTAAIGALGQPAQAQDPLKTKEGIDIMVRLEHDSKREQVARDRLAAVLTQYELRPWIITRDVLLTDEGYPHSHPIITLTTESAYYEDPERQLAAFIHEQMHWYEEAPENEPAIVRAIADLEEMYSEPPNHEEIGTRSEHSTYLHLIIGWQVLDAMTELTGEETTRRIQSTADHYEWVYRQVLNDTEAIGAVAAEHRLVVTPKKGLVPDSGKR